MRRTAVRRGGTPSVAGLAYPRLKSPLARLALTVSLRPASEDRAQPLAASFSNDATLPTRLFAFFSSIPLQLTNPRRRIPRIAGSFYRSGFYSVFTSASVRSEPASAISEVSHSYNSRM
ncbi:hypothetical protein GE061_009410 [Apolygus lucorum]|uniref:Uncharacterized protein n=1 Tax=Apolygus lucorum TaxID=248454 RepID=A0A8S9Y0F9_APOLU|nr:hypothetical protein GE061_009410 [Apolygus lucorum]